MAAWTAVGPTGSDVLGKLTTWPARWPPVRVAVSLRWRRQAGDDRWARVVVLAMVALWAWTYLHLGWDKQARFTTFGFEMGIYDQFLWLLSRFSDPFNTIRGLGFWGHHAHPGLVLLVPFYWLGAGPNFLVTVQVTALASGAIPLYLLGRDLAGPGTGMALAAALLLHPSYQWQAWWVFHPETLALAPLLWAYWLARRHRFGPAIACAALAASWKEEAVLTVAALGVSILLFDRHDRTARTIGLGLLVGAIGWYVLSTQAVIPWANGVGPFYDDFFADLGTSQAEVLRTVVTRPDQVLDLALRPDARTYLFVMLVPTAFLALLGPRGLLVGAPMLALNLVSSWPYMREIRWQYSALALVGLLLGTAEALRWLRHRTRVGWLFVALLLGASLFGSGRYGPGPDSRAYESGIWSLHDAPRNDVRRQALAAVPPGAAVSTAYFYAPHLSHREKVYEFPVPWTDRHWGVRGENLHDPGGIEWLLLDRVAMTEHDRALLDCLLASGEFAARFDIDDVVAAQRAAPPTACRYRG